MSYLTPRDVTYKRYGNKTKDIQNLREKYGKNSFTKKPRKTFLSQYLAAFADPIIKILLAALGLNLVIAIQNSNIYEPLGIAIALFLATFVSTLSEYGSENAFIKLEQQSATSTCRVMRDKKIKSLPASELVVFDTVYLSAGERVPADGVIAQGSVFVDQSALNGESAEVQKFPGGAQGEWSIEHSNLLFRGSVITSGECIMTVGRTGDSTFYGAVASELQDAGVKSPLTRRLYELAGTLAKLGYIAAALVFTADFFNLLVIDNAFDINCIIAELKSLPIMFSNVLHSLTLAITVVVVAVPEGLPMMITVVLSSNMQRLKRDNVLVRKLVGIETSGSVNILFCDKTGTITNGKLSVTGFYDIAGHYHGHIPVSSREDIIYACVLNNDSMMVGGRPLGGNATDRAVLKFAYDRSADTKTISKKIPFDSVKKYSAIKHAGVWYIKGAPERIFDKCRNLSGAITKKTGELTAQGVRVIALAKSHDMESYELIGILAINDKIRKDARYSVRTVQNAGINVCMVTGDNADTAKSIARACGILTDGGMAITSDEMSKMSDSELANIMPKLQVVARAMPSDKSRLVRICQGMGLVCGMTGDGINDAPALKLADVGFAMGSGSEVAKQAGDIVILDDNFTSISKAILYGRTIFKSIRKFIVFQLTINLCAVGVSIIGPFIGIDTPVTVMQMLWINIIMDTLAALAYAGEPPKLRYMSERPLSRTEKVLSRRMTVQILCMGLYNLAMCVAFLGLDFFRSRFGFYTNPTVFMTAFFALFIFGSVFGSFCARSERANILSGLAKNRAYILIFAVITAIQILLIYFGGEMFRTIGLPAGQLITVILMAFTVIPLDCLRKIVFRS